MLKFNKTAQVMVSNNGEICNFEKIKIQYEIPTYRQQTFYKKP